MTESMGTPPTGVGPTDTGATSGTSGLGGTSGLSGTAGTGTTGTTGTTGSTGDDTATRDVAKDEAKGVAQDAMQSGKQTAETAKEQAGEVASEAATQAKQLLSQARDELTTHGSAQKERATGGLRSLADELSGMIEGRGTQSGLAADLARQASDRARTAADWLESREPADVLDDVRSFARRRPGAFLLGAAVVGFFGGRMTRSLTEEARDQSSSGSSGTYPATGGVGSGLTGTGYAETGYAQTTGVPATPVGTAGLTGTSELSGTRTGYPDEAPGTPGYGIPPTGDTRGDATAEYTPTAPQTGLGEASTDQMPSEFGARDQNLAGNREVEDR